MKKRFAIILCLSIILTACQQIQKPESGTIELPQKNSDVIKEPIEKITEELQPKNNIDHKNKEIQIVRWDYINDKWTPNGQPPECPEPLVFQSPVDLDIVTSILYPGQYRGNDFKPHGGFRTDETDGPVEVRAPFEGYVWRAARFYDDAGIHYMFDIQNPCGIMYRLGHLGVVSPKFQAIADTLPEPKIKDSRTTVVEPVFVEVGDIIATDTQKGTGFDWGVYDLRQENEASKNPIFREVHKDEQAQAFHALCWLDYLSEHQKTIVKSLPGADGVSGKNSDYC